MDQWVKHFHICVRTSRISNIHINTTACKFPACRRERWEIPGSVRLATLAKFLIWAKERRQPRRKLSVSLCPLYICTPILFGPTHVNTYDMHTHAKKLMSKNWHVVSEREISVQRKASWNQRDRESWRKCVREGVHTGTKMRCSGQDSSAVAFRWWWKGEGGWATLRTQVTRVTSSHVFIC